jgi:putative addiction module CopG family antidote
MTMKIKLPVKTERYIRARLSEGYYGSADEMIARALSLMESVEKNISKKEQLQRAIDIGLADEKAGREYDWDVEAIKKRIQHKARRAS